MMSFSLSLVRIQFSDRASYLLLISSQCLPPSLSSQRSENVNVQFQTPILQDSTNMLAKYLGNTDEEYGKDENMQASTDLIYGGTII